MTEYMPIQAVNLLDYYLLDLSEDVRCAICQALSWPHPLLSADLYFDYYHRQCKSFPNGPGKDRIMVRKHRDIIKVVTLLKAKRATRGSVKRQICSLYLYSAASMEQGQNELFAEHWIDLAVRLWLMIDCSTLPRCNTPGLDSSKPRDQELTVNLKSAFPKSPGHLSVKLGKPFKVQNLNEIAGIGVVWTDNLANHLLLLEDEDLKVCLFHHVTYLKCQETSSIFPPGLVTETLRTLSILLPHLDKDSQKWFDNQILQSKRNRSPIDPEVHKIAPMTEDWRIVEPGGYWTYRLHLLKQAYDESEPRSLAQWWRDRRNRTLWYIFWVAIPVLVFTVFFGVVQSVEGALQVYKAYHHG